MKKLFSLAVVGLLAASCSKSYYQVYTTKPQGGSIKDNQVVFENNHLRTSYSLWGLGGNVGFTAQNISNDEVTILVDQSFYVENGWTYDYYENSTTTTHTKMVVEEDQNSSVNNFLFKSSSKKKSTAHTNIEKTAHERPSEKIPAGAKRYYGKFSVASGFYKSCDMAKYPTKRSVNELKFDEESSPYTFYNYITYLYKGDTMTMVNKFHVTSIKNVKQKDAVETKSNPDCDAGLVSMVTVMVDASPEKFYIQYSK
ncbi:MAG: hypothetical protein KDC92_07745 [Bacteroidetes bacterium]|nr:hypothetical protein [Bacteroidota bacterium]